MNIAKILLNCAVCLMAPFGVWGQTAHVFNYADGSLQDWGSGVMEDYDVAIRLADPSLAGTLVTRIEAPAGVPGTEGYTVWLSSALNLVDKKNAPDLLSVEVTPVQGRIVLELAQPVTVPEGGLYAGYSFRITELTPESKAPVTVTQTTASDAFYLHTSRRTLKWTEKPGLALDLAVTLTGNFHDNAVAIDAVAEEGFLYGNAATPSFNIRNKGLLPVNSIDWTYTLCGETVAVHTDFDTPLPPVYAQLHSVATPGPVMDEAGQYPLEIQVTGVNGIANEIEARDNATVYVYPWLPRHRPLYEEYTGTWCGWCPRGMTGMAKMLEAHPGDFIPAVYHTGDDVMATAAQPVMGGSVAPGGHLDRRIFCDPYNGLLDEMPLSFHDGIEAAWLAETQRPVTAETAVTAFWTDDSRTAIEATATARFARPYTGADFRWIMMLTADGLHGTGPEWIQSNYYSGQNKYADGDLAPLVAKSEHMMNCRFDDVIILCPEVKGIPGSLPADIPWIEPLGYTRRFELADAVNSTGVQLAPLADSLHIVAALVDTATGRIMNAARCEIGEASVNAADAGDVTATQWVVLDGTPLPQAPAKGLCIRIDTLADGSRRVVKAIMK